MNCTGEEACDRATISVNGGCFKLLCDGVRACRQMDLTLSGKRCKSLKIGWTVETVGLVEGRSSVGPSWPIDAKLFNIWVSKEHLDDFCLPFRGK